MKLTERLRRRAGRTTGPATGSAPTASPAITPAEARAEALRWVAGAAADSSDGWFVVPAHADDPPLVAVPAEDRARFLGRLAGGDAPAYLSLLEPAGPGTPERRGSVPELARLLQDGATPSLRLEPWPGDPARPSHLDRGADVALQFWQRTAEGDLLAPRRNRWTARVRPDALTADVTLGGVPARTAPVMTLPTVDECRFPIDVVCTWVDGADPAWDARRQARLAGLGADAQRKESSGRARFESRDELRYALRSIHLFAPWVRTVHLVTAGQVPAWLDTAHDRIRLVDHDEILPADALPTFNSHAIESRLHHVPDLAEHFVYLNDDVFLGHALGPETFFAPSGSFATFRSQVPIGLPQPSDPPFLGAARHNQALLLEEFGVVITATMAHTPHPHRRSVLDEIEHRFADPVGATTRSPFRSGTDVSLLSSFAQHYGLITGSAHPGAVDHAFVNLAAADVERRLEALRTRDKDFFCLGDHHEHALPEAEVARLLADFLEGYFPVPAPWELDR